jgi:hypothetical protein
MRLKENGGLEKDSTSTHIAKNSFFMEFGGNANADYGFPLGPSINYDRLLHVGKWVRTSFRIGCTIPIPVRGSYVFNVPIMLNLLIGKKSFFLRVVLAMNMFMFRCAVQNIVQTPLRLH